MSPEFRKYFRYLLINFLIVLALIPLFSHSAGAEWKLTIVDSLNQTGQYTSLALDSNNNPHISYYDATDLNLKYARYDTFWHIKTVQVTAQWVCSPHLPLTAIITPISAFFISSAGTSNTPASIPPGTLKPWTVAAWSGDTRPLPLMQATNRISAIMTVPTAT